MKVWLYYRLSRDEDDELNSLTNQRKIICEYAVTNGHEVVGESFDDKGELLITIMSSLAQEESRSISENITWGQRKSFSDGKVHLPYKRFLGYEKGEDGRPAVVESEARVVKLIYRLFLEGKTQAGICKYLEELGIPSPGAKQNGARLRSPVSFRTKNTRVMRCSRRNSRWIFWKRK